ncbi:glutathione S-transferase LANCL1-like [Linepithema humile]|uniref:glutathione S-transferase LANCL1-like n=1 Tax=Linepithema humile TaxID=83485 RepID=UPI0006233C01|nr:PREDICTED: lanC-like protein 1 [Linepithema humile]XP_012215518.1 PREDICTED: lanC-like protein 1 [Linepithema humile]
MNFRITKVKVLFQQLRRRKGYKTVIMDTSRHYINEFEDYSSSTSHNIVDNDTNTIHKAFDSLLTSEITKLIKILNENERKWRNSNDYSVYTGLAGIAYTLHHYGKYYNDSVYTKTATELLEKCKKYAKIKSRPEITFLIGVGGPFALTAVILYSQGKTEEAKELILKLKSLSTYVLDKHSNVPDELLYGRAGYLSALLYINANISPAPIEADLIKKIVSCIIDSGIAYASSNRCQSPLMYSWYDTEYIGAAHGLAGILYLLLQARQYLTQVQIDNYIKPSLHYLQKLQFSSGNFPSSLDSSSDKLVHWCHGAPGMPALFCLAHKVFEDNTFLEVAIRCGEVIWQRGLLRKGYSICHGVAGNGYAFIHLFQHTKDIKHLYRACKFAEWCFHYGSRQNQPPDRPFSLFEGLAGVIYFLIDLQQPHLAKFPTYDI